MKEREVKNFCPIYIYVLAKRKGTYRELTSFLDSIQF